MARGLKFRIEKVKGLYYLCSENKGADQLFDYRTADLRLFFSHNYMQFAGFLMTLTITGFHRNTNVDRFIKTPFNVVKLASVQLR